jgi:hypothetical protein
VAAGPGEVLPGGRVHTPAPQSGAGNTGPATGTVTDAESVRNRLGIVAQVRPVLKAAAEAEGPKRTRG